VGRVRGAGDRGGEVRPGAGPAGAHAHQHGDRGRDLGRAWRDRRPGADPGRADRGWLPVAGRLRPHHGRERDRPRPPRTAPGGVTATYHGSVTRSHENRDGTDMIMTTIRDMSKRSWVAGCGGRRGREGGSGRGAGGYMISPPPRLSPRRGSRSRTSRPGPGLLSAPAGLAGRLEHADKLD